jgi:hypothetical protein
MCRYKDGMLKGKSDDPETVNLIEGAAAGMALRHLDPFLLTHQN